MTEEAGDNQREHEFVQQMSIEDKKAWERAGRPLFDERFQQDLVDDWVDQEQTEAISVAVEARQMASQILELADQMASQLQMTQEALDEILKGDDVPRESLEFMKERMNRMWRTIKELRIVAGQTREAGISTRNLLVKAAKTPEETLARQQRMEVRSRNQEVDRRTKRRRVEVNQRPAEVPNINPNPDLHAMGYATVGYRPGKFPGQPPGSLVTAGTLFSRMRNEYVRQQKLRAPNEPVRSIPTSFASDTPGYIYFEINKDGSVRVPGGWDGAKTTRNRTGPTLTADIAKRLDEKNRRFGFLM